MTQLAVLEEQIKNLTKHIDSLTEQIKELKDIQSNKISDLERRVSLLEERYARIAWYTNVITGIVLASIIGGILSLIFVK